MLPSKSITPAALIWILLEFENLSCKFAGNAQRYGNLPPEGRQKKILSQNREFSDFRSGGGGGGVSEMKWNKPRSKEFSGIVSYVPGRFPRRVQAYQAVSGDFGADSGGF